MRKVGALIAYFEGRIYASRKSPQNILREPLSRYRDPLHYEPLLSTGCVQYLSKEINQSKDTTNMI